MVSLLNWFLILRWFFLFVSASLYFVAFVSKVYVGEKDYIRYFCKVRFVMKYLLSLFYFAVRVELHSEVRVTPFYTYVLILLVLLDLAEMWSRSYRTFGFKELRKNLGKWSILFI